LKPHREILQSIFLALQWDLVAGTVLSGKILPSINGIKYGGKDDGKSKDNKVTFLVAG
jgi:hypothetical protein